ncbi:carbon-nitrogen hydrolase family protein [Pseudonocardia asaccharolytica]|uniref:Apolipoprotein acyltransferase n=1 Tax=Pseudonocardia asaccharolytica DSM 44247 = NBRC 16224 TaxID=1123024 RepID=A0A511D6H8_9PSEU|nr:carbon-nitrogen hydrolase family protein [Pseudonocardia asaccharolytica]GEL18548.1 apolipoprotein acyltransferase [Pseudonocardia asaccharolytica DSM 44247 = NBRC 16224]
MRIALAQISSSADPKANLDLVADSVRSAAAAGARLVVFPEATMCRFGVPLGPIAEPLDGPWATAVRGEAGSAGITVVAGMFTPASDGRVYNTLLVTGRGVETSYDKIHLYDAFGFVESDTVAPGAEPVVIDVDGRMIGLTTCYDVRFPALFQELAVRGAELAVLPAAWGDGPGKRAQWDVLVRARALDGGMFVAACDQADPTTVGRDPGKTPSGIGASMVADPYGAVVDQLGAAPALLVADLDLDRATTARERTGVLANRRL